MQASKSVTRQQQQHHTGSQVLEARGVRLPAASRTFRACPTTVVRLRRKPEKPTEEPDPCRRLGRAEREERELSFDGLRSVFHLPISRAAQRLNVGVTVLKKYCRCYCIERWPYRKIHSVDKLIQVLRGMQNTSVSEEVQQELLCLRGQLLREPALDLDHKIRQLRQAVFKWQYKQRQVPCDDVDGPSAPTASSLYSFDAMS